MSATTKNLFIGSALGALLVLASVPIASTWAGQEIEP